MPDPHEPSLNPNISSSHSLKSIKTRKTKTKNPYRIPVGFLVRCELIEYSIEVENTSKK
jgi:hypothetical protein